MQSKISTQTWIIIATVTLMAIVMISALVFVTSKSRSDKSSAGSEGPATIDLTDRFKKPAPLSADGEWYWSNGKWVWEYNEED